MGSTRVLRAQILGEQPLRYSGYTSWRGVCRDPALASLTRTSESWGAGALTSGASLGDALRSYERARVRRANGIVARSRAIGRVAQWQNPLAVLIRNALFKAMPRSATQRQFARVMRFELPEPR